MNNARWVAARQTALQPLAALRALHPTAGTQIDQALGRSGQAEAELGFLPLMHGNDSDWVVLVCRSDAAPMGWVPLSGWASE